MNRQRYEGYVAIREATAAESLDAYAAARLMELAEGLLLARDQIEAELARDHVPETLASLVDRGDLPPASAGFVWGRIRECGPAMHWPPSWKGRPLSPARRALRGG